MKSTSSVVVFAVAAAVAVAGGLVSAAVRQTAPAGQTGRAGEPAVEAPRGQVPGLGRPTTQNDPMPLFDFEAYFLGKWTFEWDVPDGLLGPEGTITGTVTYTRLDPRFYEVETDAIGPAGPFKIRETVAYHRENHAAAPSVTDGRGFSYMQLGPVGGDLGGYFSIYYESSPFTYKGKTIRMKNAVRMFSPVQYQTITTVSVNGGPFMNYGSPWAKKQIAASAGRK